MSKIKAVAIIIICCVFGFVAILIGFIFRPDYMEHNTKWTTEQLIEQSATVREVRSTDNYNEDIRIYTDENGYYLLIDKEILRSIDKNEIISLKSGTKIYYSINPSFYSGSPFYPIMTLKTDEKALITIDQYNAAQRSELNTMTSYCATVFIVCTTVAVCTIVRMKKVKRIYRY